jgi:hypothetical protein
MSATPITNATAAKVDAKALNMDRVAQDAFVALSERYRLLIDDKSISVIAEISEPGVLQVVSKEVVIERDLLRYYGLQCSAGEVRNDLFPRWLSKMRANHATSLNFRDVKPFKFKSEISPGYAWQRLSFDQLETAP